MDQIDLFKNNSYLKVQCAKEKKPKKTLKKQQHKKCKFELTMNMIHWPLRRVGA